MKHALMHKQVLKLRLWKITIFPLKKNRSE